MSLQEPWRHVCTGMFILNSVLSGSFGSGMFTVAIQLAGGVFTLACCKWTLYWHVYFEFCPVRKQWNWHVYCRHSAGRRHVDTGMLQVNLVLSGSVAIGMFTVDILLAGSCYTGMFKWTLSCQEALNVACWLYTFGKLACLLQRNIWPVRNLVGLSSHRDKSDLYTRIDR